MNITISNGAAVKEELYAGNVDFDGDTFKTMLVRNGFSFNSSSHKYKKNITATTGSISCTVDATAKTFTRTTGSFITDGFVVGNYITCNHANNLGPYKVSSVSALVLRVTLVDSASMAAVTPAASMTITSDDEMIAINITPTCTLAAATQTFTLSGADAAKDWFKDYGLITGYVFETDETPANTGPYLITAIAGGVMTVEAVGGSPDVTDLSSTQIALTNSYTQEGEPTGAAVTFTVDGNTLYLDSFDISDYEPSRWGSPGAIIFSDTNANKVVIAYIRFSDWTLSF